MGSYHAPGHSRRFGRAGRLLAALVVLAALLLPLSTSAESHDGVYHWEVYGGLFDAPRGLAIASDGSLVVAQLGTGEGLTGRITKLWHGADENGNWGVLRKDLANGLPTSFFNRETNELMGPGGIAFGADGGLHFVTGIFTVDRNSPNWQAVRRAGAEGAAPLQNVAPYAWIWPYEVAHNPDGTVLDSNPYSLVLDADGNAYVNDSGANATFKVAPDGTVSTYAIYPSIPNPTDVGPPMIDAVPTGIAWGPDGALYVSQLTGVPFLQGAASVYRLEDTDGDGDALEDGEMEVYADGLTTSTAIAFDNDGNLLATELNGFLKAEAPNTGAVKLWVDGEWQTVINGLTTPTGLAVGHDGSIYVSQEFANQVLRVWHE